MSMFVTTSATLNANHPSSYIVAGTTAAANPAMDVSAASSTTPQTLSDIKLICIQRKKKSKRHVYLTFVESRPLSSPTDQPCVEVMRKPNNPAQAVIYPLSECISFEYFDTVKNDFQSFIYAYFESYTISIFFADDNLDKKPMVVKHLEFMSQSKSDKTERLNANLSQDISQVQLSPTQQQTPILPCPSTTENILHTFDIHLIPCGPIINRDHVLVGPARLYFTTTDLYIASIHCSRTDLKITIINQCPSKDRAILCIPYFTIKNYGNRSNIFLIELGKSNYGNGEIHMKCSTSSLASTIHLLVSPVIEERPLILSSAFQNQLLTNKRIEKSKNIHPPIQLNNNEAINPSILDSPLTLIRKKAIQAVQQESESTPQKTNDSKSHLVVGFFRSLTKNVSNLKRSATFHNNNNHNNSSKTSNGEQLSTLDNTSLPKDKSVAFNVDTRKLQSDQHTIILPEYNKKTDSTLSVSSEMTKKTSETILTSTSTLSTVKHDPTMGTYIDMGLSIQKSDQSLHKETPEDVTVVGPTATVDIGVNTVISLSPYVRSAIIVGNSVHLIADENTFFPIGQRSFTSPASVMQPFKTQLTGQPAMQSNYGTSSDLIISSPDSSNSLHQPNSMTDSHKSLLLSYGIVTFNNNDYCNTDQAEIVTSGLSENRTIDHRLNSDLSLMSISQHVQQGSTIQSIDTISSSSNTPMFHNLSISTSNNGDAMSLRTPCGSILFFDDRPNDEMTTYLLGQPQNLSNEANQVCLPSFNLTSSLSRPQLSHTNEENSSTNDPYALVEPLLHCDSSQSTLLVSSSNQLNSSDKSINYADLLLPQQNLPNESGDNNEQQPIINNCDDNMNEVDPFEERSYDNNERSSKKIYADIDFQQTQRHDRIVQSAANAKADDQTPPFVL